MGTQYRVKKDKITYYYRGSAIQCDSFNAVTYSRERGYERYLQDRTDNCEVGDVIIEVVGVVKERPIIQKQPLPWTVGETYQGNNGTGWKLIAILPDRLVFEHLISKNPHFTKPDGSSWKDDYTGMKKKYEDVEVGTEKYLDKENV